LRSTPEGVMRAAKVAPKFQRSVGIATTSALIKNLVSIIILFLLRRAGFAGPRVVVNRNVAPVTETSSTPLIPLGGAARAEQTNGSGHYPVPQIHAGPGQDIMAAA